MFISNQAYLKGTQYQNANRLNARIEIHLRFSQNQYGWQRWVFDQLGLKAGDHVIDLGCGPADLWCENMARLPEGVSIALCDLSFGMLKHAGEKTRSDSLKLLNLDAQVLPFKSHTFNLATANHMLYHVPDIHRALQDVQRVLKPGGKLVAATNGIRHMRELFDLLRAVSPEFVPTNDSAARFGLENGFGILREVFRHVEIRTYADSLWVTETEPLLNYIESMWGFLDWNELLKNRYRELISKEISQKGGFFIQKGSGILVARDE